MSIADVEALIQALEELKELKQKESQEHNRENQDYYNRKVLEQLERIEAQNDRIVEELTFAPLQMEELPEAPQMSTVAELEVPLPSKKTVHSKAIRKRYLNKIGVDQEVIKRLKKPVKGKKLVEVDYTVYKANAYGKIANRCCQKLGGSLLRNHPSWFASLHRLLRMADLKVLVNTYVSMMLFTAILSFFIGLGGGIVLSSKLLHLKAAAIPLGVGAGLLLALVAIVFFSLYPTSVVSSRNRLIKNDLPFAIVHMGAIAGSGAPPETIFRLLLNAGEYRGLESDLKKMVNYINLFGYDLSSALKTVAATTPSKRFKDVLNGIAATIESGGSLKSYLNSMADDTMNTYRLERKKYTDVLATYSDIYIGILIAAPLLFMVTLTIINVLGGAIGGIAVGTLAVVGAYIVIPFLNIAFILFLNIVQPE